MSRIASYVGVFIMSSIGVTNLTAINLASSVSGGQQASPGKDAAKAASATQDFHKNLKTKSARTLEDVDQANLHTDRDADGFYLPDHPEEADEELQLDSQAQKKKPHHTAASIRITFGERI